MSGSGSISSSSGGGGSAGSNCMDIRERTVLNSPNPDVISILNTNDKLKVEVQGPQGPLVAVHQNGIVAGSITSLSASKIIKCIQEDFKFFALVISVNGGRCEVEIKPEGSND